MKIMIIEATAEDLQASRSLKDAFNGLLQSLFDGSGQQDPEPKKKPNSFNDNFPARGYTHDDFEEIERRLLQVKGT